MGIQLLAPTDGNLYVNREHPPANVGFNPIQHYERKGIGPKPYQTLEDRADTAGAAYWRNPLSGQDDNQKSYFRKPEIRRDYVH